MEQRTFHMIGHGHIDPTWMWRWTEGYEEVRATFRSALARMRETPDFRFTASSACFYAWFKETEPALYAEVKQRVAEGRWELAGGWWLEPDCNVPSGESFVRQGLYGLRFFREEFGVAVRVGFNPDSFGHAATFPQLLRKLGQDCYAFMRPMAGVEKEYPGGDTFWWEASDGSRVLTANIHESYNTIPDDGCAPGEEVARIEAELAGRAQRAAAYPGHNPAQLDVLFFYGVGNHGGGPTKTALAWIEAQRKGANPAYVYSTLDDYFTAFAANTPADAVPVLRGELQHHARGCYSIHHAVKLLNRKTEHALQLAEALSAVAALEGVCVYPKVALEQAWKDLLYNQFHDVLAGTSLPSSYEDTRDQVGGARAQAHAIINRVVQAIARDIDTGGPEYTVVVFNPLAWPVTAAVEVSEGVERGPMDPAYVEHKRARIFDAEGSEVPSQVITGERVDGRRYAFVAALPAFGYRCYKTRSEPMAGAAVRAVSARALEVSPTLLENDWWRLEVNAQHGGIARLIDKRNGVNVLPGGAVLSALSDESDTWAHGVKEWRAEQGRFGGASVAVAESGAVLGRVRSIAQFGASRAITEYTLYRDSDVIDVQLRVNWQEAYTVLKWVFGTGLVETRHVAECAYGQVARVSGSGEEPCQQWVALEGARVDNGALHTFSVLNDGVFGYDATGPLLRLTLLRSPAYSHHDPSLYEADKGHEIMDQGWHTFRFRLGSHAGAWNAAPLALAAEALNQPPLVHLESGHGGARPAAASFVSLEAPGVALTVLKQAEEGEDLIVRAYETRGAAAAGVLRVAGREHALAWAAHEIKTLRIAPATGALRETNLLEA